MSKEKKSLIGNPSLKKNVFFSFLLQITSLLFPLITSPYISEVLGAENIGKVDFSATIVSFFAVFATFGIVTYGVKEVAKCRDDKVALSKLFKEMFVIRIITTAITIIVYIPIICAVPRFSTEFWLYIVQGSTLILNIMSLDWFFQGVEDYKYITIRSLLFKAIALGAIFMLVRQRADYVVYAGITVFALSASNILNFIYAKKYVDFTVKELNFKRHWKPLCVFCASAFVISIYGIVDKILLGVFNGDSAVAFYNRAKTINGIGSSIVLTFSNVFLPRINNSFIHDKAKYNELLKLSLNILMLFAIPLTIGFILLAPNVMYLFGGDEFMPATILLQIIAPSIIVVSMGTWSYQQRSLPLGKEKFGTITQIIIAVISVVMNLILLNTIGYVGVAIAWITAETIGFVIGNIYLYKIDKFNIFNLNQLKYLISAIIMGVAIYFLNDYFPVSWFGLFSLVLFGAGIYFALLLIMREKLVYKVFNARVLNKHKSVVFDEPNSDKIKNDEAQEENADEK